MYTKKCRHEDYTDEVRLDLVDKGGFPLYLGKEFHEAPRSLRRTFSFQDGNWLNNDSVAYRLISLATKLGGRIEGHGRGFGWQDIEISFHQEDELEGFRAGAMKIIKKDLEVSTERLPALIELRRMSSEEFGMTRQEWVEGQTTVQDQHQGRSEELNNQQVNELR